VTTLVSRAGAPRRARDARAPSLRDAHRRIMVRATRDGDEETRAKWTIDARARAGVGAGRTARTTRGRRAMAMALGLEARSRVRDARARRETRDGRSRVVSASDDIVVGSRCGASGDGGVDGAGGAGEMGR